MSVNLKDNLPANQGCKVPRLLFTIFKAMATCLTMTPKEIYKPFNHFRYLYFFLYQLHPGTAGAGDFAYTAIPYPSGP